MKKYIFILIISIVLAIMAIPTYMHFDKDSTSSNLESTVFNAESNPLLQNFGEEGLLQGEITTTLEGKSINITPIPNAEGEVVAEGIPNANSEDYNAVNLPYSFGEGSEEESEITTEQDGGLVLESIDGLN